MTSAGILQPCYWCVYITFPTYLILLKKRTDIVSAMEAHDVGCPDLALDVDSTEWILNRVAMSFNISWFSCERAIFDN